MLYKVLKKRFNTCKTQKSLEMPALNSRTSEITNKMCILVLLTLFHVTVDQLCAFHAQVDLLHCDLQPAERTVQPSHQQALSSWSVLTAGCRIQTRAEGLSPAEGSGPRRLSLLVTVRSWVKRSGGENSGFLRSSLRYNFTSMEPK